jgi:hypothetical protein
MENTGYPISMKTLTTLLAVLAISMSMAMAQDVTGFRAPQNLGPSQSSKAPNPHPVLTPQFGGVFVDGAKYGTQLINPAAPASFGMGEKYLSAPSGSGQDLQHESARAAHHDAGGIKLLTFEF